MRCGTAFRFNSIVRTFSHSAQNVQEIQYRKCSSLHELLTSARDALQAQNKPCERLADALPTILNGAMREQDWCALKWTKRDLIAACNGDTFVPVEVSVNGGDYRDLHRSSRVEGQRQFDAGVPVPLSLLVDHIQQLDDAPAQVNLPSGITLLTLLAVAISRLEGGAFSSLLSVLV